MDRTLRLTLVFGHTIWAAVVAAGCPADPPTLTCGAGTRLENNQCLPASTLTCGPGTRLENEACVPIDTPKPGHFLNPVVQLQNLEGVGSHTDEVRLKDDLLLNCSYTFNV